MATTTQPGARPAQSRKQFSLDGHRVIEVTLGIALIASPVVFNFSIGAFVLLAGAGAIHAGIGFAGTREGHMLTGMLHRNIDAGMVALLGLIAIVLVAAASPGAALVAAVAALGQAALVGATRYTEPREQHLSP